MLKRDSRLRFQKDLRATLWVIKKLNSSRQKWRFSDSFGDKFKLSTQSETIENFLFSLFYPYLTISIIWQKPLQESRDEIRLYPRSTNLDNGYAHIKRLRSQILLANTFRDYLILFCADYKIELFKIESEKKDGVPSARITPLQASRFFFHYPNLRSLCSLKQN